ncbi:YcgN family cysteine cluster protein [Galenea microaerophila]
MTKENENAPFWETKTLDEMTQEEWESLCDGCGLCCLNKLQDEESGEIVYTRVVCPYSDLATGQCSDYANRSKNVPTCVPLTRERVAEFDWLPDSCSYRLIYRGQPLPDWHPLVTGDPESTRKSGHGITAIPVVVDQPGLDYEDYLMEKP